ncbi:MAG: hypothetical protein IPO77_08760 [Acidobacteria bacterium]|nr:hypothetical protein [Acidobacteriota bacterium]
MKDYVYPSIFFAYFFFLILLIGAIFFFFRSFKDGYWGAEGEDVKYRMLEDDGDGQMSRAATSARRKQQ